MVLCSSGFFRKEGIDLSEYSMFDILGPVMIGPSSSHTAGSARLGKMAREIAGSNFSEVDFYLHGSFAKTYKGHGTDRALLAGVLGLNPDDEDLKRSFEIAKERGIGFRFIETDLGNQHPNTVKIVFKFKGDESRNGFYIIGSSIGGGKIRITSISGNEVDFNGDYPTLLLRYLDKKGFVSLISSTLAKNEINIATMKVSRVEDVATMVIEADNSIGDEVVEDIKRVADLIYIKSINVLE